MASVVVKNLNDGRLILKRGATEFTVPVANGDIQLSGAKRRLNEAEAYESRGAIDSLRHTTRVYPTLAFSAKLRAFTEAAAPGSPIDFIFGTGFFAGLPSSADVPGDVDQIHIRYEVEGTALGDASDHDFTCAGVHVTSADFAEGSPSTLSFSATVYGDITGDLAASE